MDLNRDVLIYILGKNYKCYDIPKSAIAILGKNKLNDQEYKVIGEYVFGKYFNEFKSYFSIENNKDVYILLCSIQIGGETQNCQNIKNIADKYLPYIPDFYKLLSYKMFDKNMVDTLIKILQFFDKNRNDMNYYYTNVLFLLCDVSGAIKVTNNITNEKYALNIYRKIISKNNKLYDRLKDLFINLYDIHNLYYDEYEYNMIFNTLFYIILSVNLIPEKYSLYNDEENVYFKAYIEELYKNPDNRPQFNRISFNNPNLTVENVMKLLNITQYRNWLYLYKKLQRGEISIEDINPDFHEEDED